MCSVKNNASWTGHKIILSEKYCHHIPLGVIMFASLCCDDDDGNCEFSKLGLQVEHMHYSETIILINI
jgi:hypothetical protein